MKNSRTWNVGLAFTLGIVLLTFFITTSAAADDVDELAAEIDRLVAARWADAGVTAAPLSDDAEFLRRIYLDVGGKIPPVSDVRSFLENTVENKRRQVVDRLLESPLYVTNFTNVWRAALIPEANADFQVRFLLPSFEAWLRQQLTDDVAYDELVRRILTIKLDNKQGLHTIERRRCVDRCH